MYPRLVIDEKKVRENIRVFWKRCKEDGVSPIAVTKVFAGDKKIVEMLVSEGVKDIADSRIINFKNFQDFPVKKWLVRTPMLSQVSDVVKYCDVSFQSELSVIKACNREAKNQSKIHEIILMVEMGDLREGIYPEEKVFEIVRSVSTLENIKIIGIGANFNCLNGIKISPDKLKELINIKDKMAEILGNDDLIISGGSSGAFRLMYEKTMPKDINQIRTGIALIIGIIDYQEPEMDFLHKDCAILEAEVIESTDKPSLPWGETTVNLVGEMPEFIDKGIRKRAICAVGRQDIEPMHLYPMDSGVEVLGASSDHLVLDIENSSNNINVGDILKFNIGYLTFLRMLTSNQVEIIYNS